MAHKFEYLGYEYSDYFQGASAMWTPYEEVFVGIGSSQFEAADDAIEQFCQYMTGLDKAIPEGLVAQMEKEIQSFSQEVEEFPEDQDEYPWHHVALYWKRGEIE